MTTTLERAARAAYEARGPKLSIPRMGVRWATWDELSPETKANETSAVRAVLQAIREPDEGAIMAGHRAHRMPFQSEDAFIAMIDHLLAEGEG